MKQRAKMAWTATLALLVAASGLGATETEKVDYEKQIKPILENNCVKCHGAKKRKGRLRLDAPETRTGTKPQVPGAHRTPENNADVPDRERSFDLEKYLVFQCSPPASSRPIPFPRSQSSTSSR